MFDIMEVKFCLASRESGRCLEGAGVERGGRHTFVAYTRKCIRCIYNHALYEYTDIHTHIPTHTRTHTHTHIHTHTHTHTHDET
jgi:hypothetical protein